MCPYIDGEIVCLAGQLVYMPTTTLPPYLGASNLPFVSILRFNVMPCDSPCPIAFLGISKED